MCWVHFLTLILFLGEGPTPIYENRPNDLFIGQVVEANCQLHQLCYPLGGITHININIWT